MKILRASAWPTMTLLVLLAIWQAAVSIFQIPKFILPGPWLTIRTTIDHFDYLIQNLWPTLIEILVGFAVSVVLSLLLAIAIVQSRWFAKSVYPLLVASQTVPKVALAPIFLIWFGFGLTSKVVIVCLIAFFPIVIAMVVGLNAMTQEMHDLGRVSAAGWWRRFALIQFPQALPNIFAGLKLGMAMAVVGAIYGEFIGADKGLGYVVVTAGGRVQTDLLFAALLVLIFAGVFLFMIVELIERWAIPWRTSATGSQQLQGTAG